MIALLLSLSFACERNLKNSMFSEVAIAKTIEDLGKDGRVFVHMLHGIPYDKISRRFGLTREEVIAIAHSAHTILMHHKESGL